MAFFLRTYLLFITSCLGSTPFLSAVPQAFHMHTKDKEEIRRYEYEALFIEHTVTMLINSIYQEKLFKTSGFLPSLEKIINEIPLLRPATVTSLSPRLLASLDALENNLKNMVTERHKTSLIKAFMGDDADFRRIVDLSDYATFKIKIPQDILKTERFEKTKNIFNKITAAHIALLYHALAQTRCIILQLTTLYEWQKGS